MPCAAAFVLPCVPWAHTLVRQSPHAEAVVAFQVCKFALTLHTALCAPFPADRQ